ncbi:Uncharacterised protein [Mycobacteroides abscessus subsp. abscessus]|nr:Uncharacterised protein [Mycobacteroides abscessus subsp. abscessus]
MRTLGVDAAPETSGARQVRRFPGEQLGQLRQEPGDARAFEDAAAERVHHRHRPAAQHLDESDHAEAGVRAQIQGIDVLGIHAAQHDIDALEGAQGAHPEVAVAHDEVGALDQREAQHPRQVGLIEGGLGMTAGTEYDDHGFPRGLGRRVDQRQPQRLRPR